MKATREQLILYAGLGVSGVIAAVLGWMIFSAAGARSDAEEELEGAEMSLERFARAEVTPSEQAIADVKANGATVAAWRNAAVEFAARGDRTYAVESASVFKQRLRAETARLGAIAPAGAVEGSRLAAPGFEFGFGEYLGDSMPSESVIPELEAQLAIVTHIADVLAAAGVASVTEIERPAAAPAKPVAETAGKKNAKPKKVKKEDVPERAETKRLFKVGFTARPAAFIRVLNAFAADEAFYTVTKLGFSAPGDVISDKIQKLMQEEIERANLAKRAAAKTNPRRNRRNRRNAEAEPEEEKPAEEPVVETPQADRLVIDPEIDAPVEFSMMLQVDDFGYGPDNAAKAKAAAEAAAADPSAPTGDASSAPTGRAASMRPPEKDAVSVPGKEAL